MRREDMKKLLLATKGKVFTLKTMDQLVEHSLLRQFRTKAGESMLAKELDSQSSNPQVRFAPLVSGPIEELLLLQLATISFAIRS